MSIGFEQEGFEFNTHLGVVSQLIEISNGALQGVARRYGDRLTVAHEIGNHDAGVFFPTRTHGDGVKDRIHVRQAFKEQ